MTSNCSKNSSSEDLVFVGLYALIFTLGLVLNLAALYIFFRCSNVRSFTTVYMKNLAVSDLLLVVSLPVRIYYYSRRPCLGVQVCEIMGLLLLVNMYGSIFLLTCISGDRCMAVCFPLHPRVKALRKQAKYICLCVWLLSCAGTVPTYFTQPEKGELIEHCFDNQPKYVTQPSVSSAMALCFVLPLLVMVVCSWALLRAIQRSAAAQMELVNSAKIRSMIVANITIFLGCFLPFHLVLICYQVDALQGKMLDLSYRCTLLVASANAALDPLAYYFATETFQRMVVMDNLRKAWGFHSDSAEGQNRSQTALGQCIYLQNTTTLPNSTSLVGSPNREPRS
ncbi:lysophosphatidic acid receptor 6-like [Dermochelys coriacea]|uniref:lysophosphatidic acid receptor 6-like n=1 Tax=Dermochelys coriacea TaxID=27794 RepID=UPI0018E77F59|nr:lysophosphatidic acid receptor 6-like [Dermochelys coriacea]XP_038242004.1 lysophosphatidic acid receptor 6-like [Dermochelys coriacea]XP_038242005.1 lysophosphatidic acid receptor 6-like [Dermochelys coriacea]XP_043359568.1 lysophosphatidic acid receptor 6-like [Dermochelys coriacea]